MSYSHVPEKWVVTAKKADFYGLAQEFGVDPVIVRLMVNRGVADRESIRRYLYGTMADTHDAGLMKDAALAAEILEAAIEDGRKIGVASDFDVDGIFSGQLLYEGLTGLGAEVLVQTPDRVKDGYGMNVRMADGFAAWGAGLIVTCDNGIAAFDALDRAAELGIPVIVTDHHEVPYEEADGERRYMLPRADAIVDPKQADCGYPFKGLCGAGVAYKVLTLLYRRMGRELPERFLEYVAVATVCDVMDLTDENRIMVKRGLKLLEHTENPGLRALIAANGLTGKTLNAYHMGFVIGPCFNAAGRLETTEKPLELLRTKDPVRAEELALDLKALNDSRKAMTENGTKQAVELIESSSLIDDRILVLPLEGVHESLAGIIAGRLRERYARPVIVLTATAEGYKGSGRSIEAYHMFEGLTACRDLLTRFGGHAMAAGLSLEQEHLDELRSRLNEQCGLSEEDLRPTVRIDAAMPIGYITEELIGQLDLLEPMGKANEKPVFAENLFHIRRASVLGKNRNFLKLRVINSAGTAMDALLFSGAEDFAAEAAEHYGQAAWNAALRGDSNPVKAALAYYPSVNEYMGRRTIQIVISNYQFK